MKKFPTVRKRPGVLVRFYPSDLALLSQVCASACTPRENYIRRVVLAQVAIDSAAAASPAGVAARHAREAQALARSLSRPKGGAK